ncbi:hypothetical protein AB0K87_01650 [Streptomyces sp. NPDC053705]|uniref:hypothetical protein n=1 Tax=Streptomyces sp. NPDC053705 TaxID=3156668 RepID=UPI0034130DA6
MTTQQGGPARTGAAPPTTVPTALEGPMSPTPTNPAAWSDGDPLMEAIAAAVYEQAETTEGSLVVDDPRNIAAVAATVTRRVLGTTNTNTETPAPAVDRATVLTEAADTVQAMNEGCSRPKCVSCTTRTDAADALRDSASRMAAEAQQPTPAETEETTR